MTIAATLFALLDACVDADQGPAGFDGRIALGVLESRTSSWWVADFGPTTRRTRASSIPVNCDVAVMMSERDVARLLDGRGFDRSSDALRVLGDRQRLHRFLERYIKRQNMLGIRANGFMKEIK